MTHEWTAEIELLAGEPAAAEREARQARELLNRTSDPLFASTATARLAEIRFRQGFVDEAEELMRIAEQRGASNDLDLEIRMRSTKAKLLDVRGDLTPALRLAGEAVAIARRTEWLNHRGDALVALAEVRSAGGDTSGGLEAALEAIGEYENKGNLASAGRARALLAQAGERSRG